MPAESMKLDEPPWLRVIFGDGRGRALWFFSAARANSNVRHAVTAES